MTLKLGHRLRIKTFLGDIREGRLAEILSDGSVFVELEEQILPDLATEVLLKDKKGGTFTIFKQKFPTWQAWVTPDRTIRNLTLDKMDVV